MSARRGTTVLAPNAEADIEDILLYGRRQWGDAQADTYVEDIRAALRRLADFPFIGPARPDLFPGARSLSVGQHRIFYHVTGSTVRVVRILHARADAGSQLAAKDDELP
jgi:toxin ParE1/3/4